MKKFIETIKAFLISLLYVAIYFAVGIIVQLAYMLWQESLGKVSSSEIALNVMNNSYALTVIATIITFWIYLIIFRKIGTSPEKIAENKNRPPIIYAMAVCLAVGMRMLVTVYYAYSQNVEVLKRSIDAASATAPQLDGAVQLVVALFSIAVIAPLFEEFLFRGMIMKNFLKIMRPWAAIFLQALIFGVAHGVLFQSIFTAIAGIVFGVVYYRTRNLKTVVVCHSVFNLSVILAQNSLNFKTGIVMAAMGLVLVVFSLIYILAYCKRQ